MKKIYYLAKNHDSNIHLFGEKPTKNYFLGIWTTNNWNDGIITTINDEEVPEGLSVSWNDDEPIEVVLNLIVFQKNDERTEKID